MILKPADLKIFEKQGYFLCEEPLFPHDDFLRLKKYLFSYINELPENISTRNFTNLGVQPKFIDWAASPPIIELIESIIGPDIALWSFGLCYKPPHSKVRVAAHTDSHYWIEWGLLSPLNVVGIFISMSDMTKESGCLKVLPGINEPVQYRHKKVSFRENFFDNEIDDPRIDLSKMIDLEMKENRICLTKENLIHASEYNSSPNPRLGITLRFISGKTKYNLNPLDDRSLYLLKGEDHAGNPYRNIAELQPLGGFSWSKK